MSARDDRAKMARLKLAEARKAIDEIERLVDVGEDAEATRAARRAAVVFMTAGYWLDPDRVGLCT